MWPDLACGADVATYLVSTVAQQRRHGHGAHGSRLDTRVAPPPPPPLLSGWRRDGAISGYATRAERNSADSAQVRTKETKLNIAFTCPARPGGQPRVSKPRPAHWQGVFNGQLVPTSNRVSPGPSQRARGRSISARAPFASSCITFGFHGLGLGAHGPCPDPSNLTE